MARNKGKANVKMSRKPATLYYTYDPENYLIFFPIVKLITIL